MEHSEGKELPQDSESEAPKPEPVAHLLVIQLGAAQHQFEFPNREDALSTARKALTQGWVEIENERAYLLVMAGPNSGACFLVMPKADVLAQRAAAQQAQVAAQTQQIAKRLVLPNGR